MKIGSFEFKLRELAGSLLAGMAVGFAAGLAAHYLLPSKEHRHASAQQ